MFCKDYFSVMERRLKLFNLVAVVLVISQVSYSLPATLTNDQQNIASKGYIKVPLDDVNIKELSNFAVEEIRKDQKNAELSLKATVFALKELTSFKTRNYKLTMVLIKTGKKTSSRSLLCNVDIIYGTSVDQRKAKTIDCLKANIVSGLRSISSNGTVQEDADLASAIFAANQLDRLNSTMNNNSSSSPVLMHYTSSLIEMITGLEYKLKMKLKGSSLDNQVLVCDINVLPRKPRILHKANCGEIETELDDSTAFNETSIDDSDVKETAEFAADALTQRRGRMTTDRLSLISIDKAWKRPVRGIQRRLRLTLSHDDDGFQPSSYCYAVVFEDRLTGQYKLVTSPGTTICSSTPPTD